MTTKAPSSVEILLCDNRGIYIPRDFVTDVLGLCSDDFEWIGDGYKFSDSADTSLAIKWGLGDAATVLANLLHPDSEYYWDSWATILDNARNVEYGHTLWQDGDLFAVNSDMMSDEEYKQFWGESRD